MFLKKKASAFIGLFYLIGWQSVLAQEGEGVSLENMCAGNLKELCQKKSRLIAYQPNTAAWEFAHDDDGALEVNYSFRYLLTRPDCSVEKGTDKLNCITGWQCRKEWFLSYTGKFDFYMHTRPSGPVVNRMNNPAAHWRIHNPALRDWVEWVDIGMEHRSNGQTTEFDLKDTNGNYIAEQRWNAGDRAYIDGISRSANYFSAEVKNSFKYGSELPPVFRLPRGGDHAAKFCPG